MSDSSPTIEQADATPWYAGVTRYQWLVLIIAAAGWAFDQYESQIFVVTKDQILKELHGFTDAELNRWTDYLYAVFLLGSATGGLLAGSLADRFGRRPLLIATILFYSIFSGATYFAGNVWQVLIIRFFVAMGIGGEWAVGASLVAETFPRRARSYVSGMFHSSSVLGIWAATLVGLAVGQHWRVAYLIGILPALLTFWVIARMHEPEKWQAEAERLQGNVRGQEQLGSFRELLLTPRWSRRALLGLMLSGVGLATFWGVMVKGQDLTRDLLHRNVEAETNLPRDSPDFKQALDEARVGTKTKFAYGFVQITAAGIGMLMFGPICDHFGRRNAFITFHLLAFLITPITCFLPQTYWQMLLILPFFGFMTQSFHAGYAIYFPELFPTHLRATGTSFCFNGGRVVAAPMLFLSAHLEGADLRIAVTCFATLFLIGAVIMLFLPETKGQELPE